MRRSNARRLGCGIPRYLPFAPIAGALTGLALLPTLSIKLIKSLAIWSESVGLQSWQQRFGDTGWHFSYRVPFDTLGGLQALPGLNF